MAELLDHGGKKVRGGQAVLAMIHLAGPWIPSLIPGSFFRWIKSLGALRLVMQLFFSWPAVRVYKKWRPHSACNPLLLRVSGTACGSSPWPTGLQTKTASQVQSCRNVCPIGSGQLINCRGDSGSFEKQGVHGGPGVSKISKSNHPQNGWKNWLLDLFKLGSPAFPKRYQPLDGKDLCRSQKKGPTLPRKPWKTHGTSMEKSLKPVEKAMERFKKATAMSGGAPCHVARASFAELGDDSGRLQGVEFGDINRIGGRDRMINLPSGKRLHNYGKSPFQWVNPL